jgi:hypothetical protein
LVKVDLDLDFDPFVLPLPEGSSRDAAKLEKAASSLLVEDAREKAFDGPL